ncbi:hypothetical protein [Streptomyces sioyaensis]|uniref:hypothetical protein n=1 Tax=Streptomyces sioyaensis TaxID=67364 RepID=UPI00379AF6A9
MTSWNQDDLPPLATFEDLAALLRKYDLDPHATGDNVRYRARTDPAWPIGEGKPYAYVKVSNARTAPPRPVLRLYEEHPRVGRRGPDKKPRQPRGTK